MGNLGRLSAAVCLVVAGAAFAAGPKPETSDPAYRHDRFETRPRDLVREFRAFTVSFDSADDDDGDGQGEARGVPEWVACEVKRFEGECVPTGERPAWFTDEALALEGLAPRDDSYRFPAAERKGMKNGFDRGHLAPKFLAARLGEAAEWNTHTLLNAVPQRHEFNAGIWLDLERLTGAWAQRYGSVWVIAGPVFHRRSGHPPETIGDTAQGEFPVAVPDALFKLVVRETAEPAAPVEVLAFLYPQEGSGYAKGPFHQKRFLATVDEVERLTGLDFLTALPDGEEEEVEGRRATELWPVEEKDFVRECGGRRD